MTLHIFYLSNCHAREQSCLFVLHNCKSHYNLKHLIIQPILAETLRPYWSVYFLKGLLCIISSHTNVCSGTHSGHFSATSTSCAVHMWHEVTELPFKPVEEKAPSRVPGSVGEKWPQAPAVRRCCILFTRKRWAEALQSQTASRKAGDGKSWFGVKPRPRGTGCQQGLRFTSWATQSHKATAETLLSTGSQGSGPTGLSVDIQLLIYRSWPVPSQMTLPAQRADRASPCDTETRVNPAQLAALGKKKMGGKRGGRED